jgi:hypothetical protein
VYVGGTALTYANMKEFLDSALSVSAYPDAAYFTILDHVTNSD